MRWNIIQQRKGRSCEAVRGHGGSLGACCYVREANRKKPRAVQFQPCDVPEKAHTHTHCGAHNEISGFRRSGGGRVVRWRSGSAEGSDTALHDTVMAHTRGDKKIR